jgi:hypothetical protein
MVSLLYKRKLLRRRDFIINLSRNRLRLMSNHFELILCLLLLKCLSLFFHHTADISTKNHFLLTIALSEKLLDRYRGLIIKVTDQELVNGFNEAVVRLCIQVKTVCCHELSDLRRKHQQCMMNEWQESEWLTLHD